MFVPLNLPSNFNVPISTTFYLQSHSPPPLAEALFCQDFLSLPEALYLSKGLLFTKRNKDGTEFYWWSVKHTGSTSSLKLSCFLLLNPRDHKFNQGQMSSGPCWCSWGPAAAWQRPFPASQTVSSLFSPHWISHQPTLWVVSLCWQTIFWIIKEIYPDFSKHKKISVWFGEGWSNKNSFPFQILLGLSHQTSIKPEDVFNKNCLLHVVWNSCQAKALSDPWMKENDTIR